ncbi:glycine cleavage T C-terminal barrel domain-containing protein [Mesorhizobium sp.]|uniref:glycine cleavage T C-terminal barrel domain-containing protein n=1 Tax=Mesorhizobium sp. TaxID=1871066 RepID=UPI00257D0E1E|nr:glycine cleavage T C-terminal barrel domain-containing protein [Mesorhizobium sp.]
MRTDYSAAALRRLAKGSKNANQSRRLLSFFIGKRSLEIRGKTLSNRKLVGFSLDRMPAPGLQESNLVVKNGQIAGFITSITYSPTLSKVTGLAYADRADANLGGHIMLRSSEGSQHQAEVVDPHFYDPDNKRQGCNTNGHFN